MKWDMAKQHNIISKDRVDKITSVSGIYNCIFK